MTDLPEDTQDAPTPLTRADMAHKEAFCLMKYRNRRGGPIEVIWNARDGVTPFAVLEKDTSDGPITMDHVEWQDDQFCPDFVAQPGQRMFITWRWEDYVCMMAEALHTRWDDNIGGCRGEYRSKDRFIEDCCKDTWQKGKPRVVEVGKDGTFEELMALNAEAEKEQEND